VIYHAGSHFLPFSCLRNKGNKQFCCLDVYTMIECVQQKCCHSSNSP